MKLHLYQPHELNFAYCYRIYLRWRTHKGIPNRALANLTRTALKQILVPYNIRVLQSSTSETDLLCIVSLRPTESISSCASKLKGRVSKWLREGLGLQEPVDLLSKGYFGCTIGKSKSDAIERYLNSQAEHHGYDQRKLPPVFVEQYHLSEKDKVAISPKHAVVVAKFHLVLSTLGRRGILGSQEGRKIAARWRGIQNQLRIALIKVSFLPDHVHVAFRAHPAVSPAVVTAALMNSAQEVVQIEMIQAGLERLWRASAYLGSYGDLASPQIANYIENWRKD